MPKPKPEGNNITMRIPHDVRRIASVIFICILGQGKFASSLLVTIGKAGIKIYRLPITYFYVTCQVCEMFSGLRMTHVTIGMLVSIIKQDRRLFSSHLKVGGKSLKSVVPDQHILSNR